MKVKQQFKSQSEAIDYLVIRGWSVYRSTVSGVWLGHPKLNHLNLVRRSGSKWIIESL